MPRLEQLVSVRGIAAWLVVLFHSLALLKIAVPALPSPVVDVIAHGYLAVDFFFVLSGFIIFINYYDKFNTRIVGNSLLFYWNRFSRIYPVHFFMLIGYSCLALAYLYFSSTKVTPNAFTLKTFLENLFLVQAWAGNHTSWNVPSWSISAEWFVYLLFPVFSILLGKFRNSYSAHIAVATALLAAVFFIDAFSSDQNIHTRFTNVPLVRAFYEFSLGTIIGSGYINFHEKMISHRIILAALLLLSGLVTWRFGAIGNGVTALNCCILVWLLCLDQSYIKFFLSNRVLVYLGEISYSTYMIHYFVYDVYKAVWIHSITDVNLFSLVASFSFLLILSMAMHRMIELPAQRYLRSWQVSSRRVART